MRKLFLCLASVCLSAAVLAGCADKNGEENMTGDMPALVAEDLKQGNDTVFNMEKGIIITAIPITDFGMRTVLREMICIFVISRSADTTAMSFVWLPMTNT